MKLIILDRDGVINVESAYYIKSPQEWHAIPGSLEAIARLNQAGFTVGLATNQSGIARGFYAESMLHKIHDHMQAELAKVGGKIDIIRYCPHHPNAVCLCRKPKAGMLESIATELNYPISAATFVGDSTRDILAAHTIGCRGILVKTGMGIQSLPTLEQQYPAIFQQTLIYDNLSAVVDDML